MSVLRAFSLGGQTGVSLFFVLSGFLLSRPFLAEAWGGRRSSRGRYFANRSLRILPLYVAAVAFATIACADGARDLLRGLPYLAFLHGAPTLVEPLLPYSGAWWSLATEVQFYLLLPLLPLVLRSRAAATLALAVLAAYAALCLGWVALPSPEWQFTAAHALLGRAPLFVWGIVAAWIFERHGGRIRARVASAGALGRIGADVLLVAAALALGLVLQWVVAAPYVERQVAWPAYHALEGALWAVVLLVLVLARSSLGLLLGTAAAAFLGRVSYPLFLVHTGVMIHGADLVRSRWPDALTGWTSSSGAIVAGLVAAAILVATLAHVAIERPALRWKARLARREPAAARSSRPQAEAA